jgi:hypothetical protein
MLEEIVVELAVVAVVATARWALTRMRTLVSPTS